MPSLLPREGLTLEAAFAPTRILFEPFFTGPILLALLYLPRQSQTLLPNIVQLVAKSTTIVSTLKTLVVIGVLGKINNLLSRLVHNNFTNDGWKAGQEIAVVTGGSSGVGLALVNELAKSS